MFIFRAIKKIISQALKAVYRLLCVFNLQFTILVVLVGVLLWALGVFEQGGFALIRQSNTEPVFTLRFEATDADTGRQYEDRMVNKLMEIIKEQAVTA